MKLEPDRTYQHFIWHKSSFILFLKWSDILWFLFDLPALYFTAVATVASFIGQHAVRKLINILGRASLIIFILAFTIFVSAISLGKDSRILASLISYRKVALVSCYAIINRFLTNASFLMYDRWSWYLEHDHEDSEPRLYGVWKPLQVPSLVQLLDLGKYQFRVKNDIGWIFLWF